MQDGELKVVIHLRGDSALLGVQKKDTDPVMETILGASLEQALAAVPNLVTVATEKWAVSPRGTAYQAPPSAPRPALPAVPRQASGQQAQDSHQPRMY